MIAIVNYGSGNIQAIGNIYNRLKIPYIFAATPAELEPADRIILPGVGAFDQAMNQLERSGVRRTLERLVLEEKRPLLGICVGMQLLARRSEEGSATGLGWIPGEVRRFAHTAFQQRTHLPHMGWNTVEPLRQHPLFDGIDLATGYYFLHSYYFSSDSVGDTVAVTDYGGRFASVVQRGNVHGVQFHPEKSHQAGIDLLRNFAALAA